MKWAPNKMLHFEVAIIKAIQSLGQATLDEVIEKLSQLRDGKSVSQKQSPSVVAGVPPASGKLSADTAATTAAAVTDSGYNKSAPRVAETSPDANELWQQALVKIPAQKAFVRNSATAAHVLGIEGRNFQLGFAPGDKAMMDILGTQANRKFLETLLHEITGTDWSVKLTVREELPSKQAPPSEGSRPENFKGDPLIEEAIGLFNAQIVQES
jgi:DNA polymerase-3 subunit gamma/tau